MACFTFGTGRADACWTGASFKDGNASLAIMKVGEASGSKWWPREMLLASVWSERLGGITPAGMKLSASCTTNSSGCHLTLCRGAKCEERFADWDLIEVDEHSRIRDYRPMFRTAARMVKAHSTMRKNALKRWRTPYTIRLGASADAEAADRVEQTLSELANRDAAFAKALGAFVSYGNAPGSILPAAAHQHASTSSMHVDIGIFATRAQALAAAKLLHKHGHLGRIIMLQ